MLELMRRPGVRAALVGIVVTLVVTVIVVAVLLLTPGGDIERVSKNAALIGALVALGGVATTQLVNIALEDQRAHEAALRAYLEHIGELMRDHKLTRWDQVKEEVRTAARAETLAVLKGLRRDPDRKRILMIFLSESGLIENEKDENEKDRTILSLTMADLTGANLDRLGPPLGGPVLCKKKLSGSFLNNAKLQKTHLKETDLENTDLTGANLKEADLTGANLKGANLKGAKKLTQEQLEQAIGDETTNLPRRLKMPKTWTQFPRTLSAGS